MELDLRDVPVLAAGDGRDKQPFSLGRFQDRPAEGGTVLKPYDLLSFSGSSGFKRLPLQYESGDGGLDHAELDLVSKKSGRGLGLTPEVIDNMSRDKHVGFERDGVVHVSTEKQLAWAELSCRWASNEARRCWDVMLREGTQELYGIQYIGLAHCVEPDEAGHGTESDIHVLQVLETTNAETKQHGVALPCIP